MTSVPGGPFASIERVRFGASTDARWRSFNTEVLALGTAVAGAQFSGVSWAMTTVWIVCGVFGPVGLLALFGHDVLLDFASGEYALTEGWFASPQVLRGGFEDIEYIYVRRGGYDHGIQFVSHLRVKPLPLNPNSCSVLVRSIFDFRDCVLFFRDLAERMQVPFRNESGWQP